MRRAAGIILLMFAALFALKFEERYWSLRDCFDELGRCFDPASQHVYLEQTGIVLGGLAVLCLMGGAAFLAAARRRR